MLLLIAFTGVSQTSLKYFDSLTYRQYMDGRYKELLISGKEALDNGHDYYYLRMRLGIANYELKRFGEAALQFNAAMNMSLDATSAEYYYYSLVYAGRTNEARIFLCSNRELLSKVPGKCSDPLSGTFIEGGLKWSDGKVREIGTISFLHAGLQHLLHPRWEIYQGYTRTHQELYSFTYGSGGMGNGPGPGGSGDSVEYRENVSLDQNEYYARVSYFTAKGLELSPAFHFQSVVGLDNNYAGSLRLSKRFTYVLVSASAAYSRISQLDQQLYGIKAVIYPRGDINLYLGGELNYHVQSDGNWVYVLNGGVQITNALWLQGMYGGGQMFNYADMHAFYLYNIPDVINTRFNIMAILRIAGRHLLQAGYLYEKKNQIETGTDYRHRGLYLGLTLNLQ